MNNRFKFLSLLLLGSLLFSSELIAKEIENIKGNNNSTNGSNKAKSNCLQGKSKVNLDINNVRAMMLNAGDMWWDQGGTDNARYEIPKITDPNQIKKHSLFAGSVWIGGIDRSTGNVLVTGETYRQSNSAAYWPGPVMEDLSNLGSIDRNECDFWNRHFKVDLTSIEKFKLAVSKGQIDETTDFTDLESDEELSQIIKWPGKGNPYYANDQLNVGDYLNKNYKNLAPFIDVDNDGKYDPRKGDYPDITGDQAIWWVLNDVGNEKNLGDGQLSIQDYAIGLELQTTAFAFKTNDDLNNMTFYKQSMNNRGPKTLDSAYIGQWVDADLGNYVDDFVGCDVGRGLGICYNGDEDDDGLRGYGLNPPSIGVDFFQGPDADTNDLVDNDRDGEIDEPGERIIMSKFLYYNNDQSPVNGNPDARLHFYNYLRNLWKNGTKVTYDGADGTDQNKPRCDFMFPGDTDQEIGWGLGGTTANPVSSVPWSEETSGNTPADRRFLQSAGPFTLDPGETIDVIIGVIWFRSGSGGPTGSINGLKRADDKAQKLFENDFKLIQGPNAPYLAKTELDQKIILAIQPDSFEVEDIGMVTTETFLIKQNALDPTKGDPYYRFQGYQLYQLKKATTTDFSNPDEARLIGQWDIKDGVGIIINEDQTFNGVVMPEIKVDDNGNLDNGIVHSVELTKDAFTGQKLVNNKEYYYKIIAYAYCSHPDEPERYKESNRNIGDETNGGNAYVCIPHKIEPVNGGTVLNSSYGQQLPVKRLGGSGNGGNVLELLEGEESKILNKTTDQVFFKGGNAPVSVKVYDPTLVKNGNFDLKFSSSLTYNKTIYSNFDVSVGDTIESIGDFTQLPFNVPASAKHQVTKIPQTNGVAVVKRLLPVEINSSGEEIQTLELEIFNENDGGAFVLYWDSIVDVNADPAPTEQTWSFIKYGKPINMNFINKATGDTALPMSFSVGDLWTLTDLSNGNVIYSEKSTTILNEQLVPEYGISINVENTYSPGYFVYENIDNGLQTSSLEFENDNKWFKPFTNSSYVWVSAKTEANLSYNDLTAGFVEGANFYYLVDSAVTHYQMTSTITSGGPAYYSGIGNPIISAGNVDIVITPDKSKWTRVCVLQADKYATGFHPSDKMLKSTVPSVDKDGNADGSVSGYLGNASTGMSWFPGYAIDLDKGIRLNMMFSENRLYKADGSGENLKWELPYNDEDIDDAKNYIYVFGSEYDECKEYETRFDSLKATFPNVQITNYIKDLFSECMYVANFMLEDGKTMLEDEARVKIRVDKEYRSIAKGDVPEYFFTTEGFAPITNSNGVAESALDLIRAVPNPYYAFSEYESFTFDNIVKFTNLPQKCTISIYTANGTLVKSFKKDSEATFLDWKLQTADGLPIASGVYIVHIDAPGIGSKTIKWFGVMRPLDLDSF